MTINLDQLQNEVLTIAHHLDDIEKAITDKAYDYALEGLKDAKEAIKRLNGLLPGKLQYELDRMAEDIYKISMSIKDS